MHRTTGIILRILLTSLCLWGATCLAQTRTGTTQPKGPAQSTTLHDAAGRTHVRSPRLKHSDRKAAALRQAQARRAKTAERKQVTK